jgi:hypothetical protein
LADSDDDIRRSLRQGYLLKIRYALKSGHVHWEHITRARQVLAACVRTG